MRLVDSYTKDPRIQKLNAIIFLTVKPIGERNTFKNLTDFNKYQELVNYASDNMVPIGFDSCGCYNFLNSVKNTPHGETYSTYAESCESTLFSIYVNCDGVVSPCSFTEKINGTLLETLDTMNEVIDLNNCNDLLMDVWYSNKFNKFRRALLSTVDTDNQVGCRYCPAYHLNMKDRKGE